jgi:HD-like signal output (HDOD) protein
MRRQGDFPALADSMGRILKVAGSDDHSLEDLAREILRDVALTQQLLRLVNSAQYAQVSGMVTTVSRAVGLVGFNGVTWP